jgi:hypothetical protein
MVRVAFRGRTCSEACLRMSRLTEARKRWAQKASKLVAKHIDWSPTMPNGEWAFYGLPLTRDRPCLEYV